MHGREESQAEVLVGHFLNSTIITAFSYQNASCEMEWDIIKKLNLENCWNHRPDSSEVLITFS